MRLFLPSYKPLWSPTLSTEKSRKDGARKYCGWSAMIRRRKTIVAVLGIICGTILLSGCKPVGPDYKKPAYTAPTVYKETGAPTVAPPPNPAGGSWNAANPSDGMLRGKWWEVFGDPQLNKLEERIATENQALQQAMHNYLAARDQVRPWCAQISIPRSPPDPR